MKLYFLKTFRPKKFFLPCKILKNFFSLIRTEAGVILSNIVQANNFSGIVSNVFTKKLSDISSYKSYNDQRYPDLMHIDRRIGLEVKASNKAWKGGEGHNGHTDGISLFAIRYYHVEILSLYKLKLRT